MSTGAGRAFTIPAHVVCRRIGEEVVILDLEGGTYFGLDPVGTRAWELIAEGRSLAGVQAVMREEYAVDDATLEQDLHRLIAGLRAHKLLT